MSVKSENIKYLVAYSQDKEYGTIYCLYNILCLAQPCISCAILFCTYIKESPWFITNIGIVAQYE